MFLPQIIVEDGNDHDDKVQVPIEIAISKVS